MRRCLYLLLGLLGLTELPVASAQAYRSFFTGDTADVQTPARGGIVLMGGGEESDAAMRWFMERCAGGDVVVLRASGADGYNDYLFRQLGVAVNSVESIVTPDQAAANDPYVARQLRRAEGVWIAGGDQANYVRWWRDSPVGDALHDLIESGKCVMGGTSAGMAIMGALYFAALNGTIQSAEALVNPYNSKITIGGGDFLQHPLLDGVLTDMHYDNRERRGRHLVFMARAMKEFGIFPKGMACNEQTAICIDTAGYARVFGHYPEHNDLAYFLQVNCENPIAGPETCVARSPLHWVRGRAALNVWVAPGYPDGRVGVDLRDWQSAQGGHWENWWVEQGTVQSAPAEGPPPCASERPPEASETGARDWAISAPGYLNIPIAPDKLPARIRLYDMRGQLLREWQAEPGVSNYRAPGYCHGPHIVVVTGAKGKISQLVNIP